MNQLATTGIKRVNSECDSKSHAIGILPAFDSASGATGV